MWPFTTNSHLGIDIGTTAVKLVEAEKKGNQIKLINYGEFKILDFVDQGKTQDPKLSLRLLDNQISQIINLVLKETGSKTKEVTFSIPALSTFTTIITVPEMT